MQILYWHLTHPQTSTCGGSTSPPLLQRRDEASFSAKSTSQEKLDFEEDAKKNSSQIRNTHKKLARLPPLSVPGDAGGSRRSPNRNMEIENDDQTPTFYLLNAIDVPADEDAALNHHHLELINGQNNNDNPYNSNNGPLVAVGNGSSGDGGGAGNGSGPPGGHYSGQTTKGTASKRKKRRSNDLARVLCVEEDSEDESAVNVGPSKSKKAKLIVNLYPEDQGYSFGYHVPGSNECSESHAIPYSERYLLDSIDAEQIPSKVLCKLEDREGVHLMRYRNQVIAEIRDYRKSMGVHSRQNITATINIPGLNSISILPTPNGSSSLANGTLGGGESQKKPVVKQVMLSPTTESLLCDFDLLVEKGQQDRGGWNAVFRQSSGSGDVSHLVPDGSDSEHEYEVDLEASQKSECNYLTYDQRLELERKFVNMTAGPLCLDPSPQVSLIANRMQFEKFKWNTEDMRMAAKRWEENPLKSHKMTISTSDGTLNAPSLAEGRLDIEPFYNFVMSVKAKRELSSRTFGIDKDTLRLPPIQYQDYPSLDPPKNIEEILRIGQIPEPAQLRVFPNENFVRKIEEYILETERRKRPHTTTLSIFQRNGMESYFGELEMESFLDPTQPRIGSPPSSTKCQFELGSSRNVTLYVKQFSDIFTEDGRRPCKITYQKVGQPPQIVYTNSYKSATAPTPPVPGTVTTAVPSPPTSQTISAVTASVPQTVTTLATPIVVNAASSGVGSNSTVTVVSSSSSAITSSPSQIVQAVTVSSPGALPTSVTVPGIVSVPQAGVQLQRPPTPVSATTIVVTGTAGAVTTSSVPTLPPVQIVHPQPRTTPQQQQQQQAQKPQTTGQQRQIQIFSQQQAQPQNVTVPAPVTPASANVNLNLNLNSPGITPQQVLTRPHIVNVNLQQQQQQQQAAAQQQLLQLTQQRLLRMKQQQPNTALAKLLLTNFQTKPITVAVQPTPQNPGNVVSSSGATCSSSTSSSVVSCISSTNANSNSSPAGNSSPASNNAIASPAEAQPNPLGSPIMITSPPSTSSTITAPSPNVNVNVNAAPNVSVNLNTISLDGLLNASSASYANATTLTTNQAGGNMNLGLSRITTSTGQPAVNILRLNNNTGTMATATGGNTVQLAAVQRQLTMSNALNGNVSILQQGSQQPQQRILINANSMNNLNLNSVGASGEIDELSVPDLTTLLGGQPIQISQLGQQQHILTNATAQPPSQTTIDTTNLNLNLNVNLNSGTVVNSGDAPVQQHQIAKIQGGEWTTTAQAPPFLVFISPLRPMSIATQAQAQTTRQVSAGTVTNQGTGLSLNLGTVQQQQQVVQSQPGKVPEGPTRILLGTCNNGVAIKREVATSVASSTAPALTSSVSSVSVGGGNNDHSLPQQNSVVDNTSHLESGSQLMDSQQVSNTGDVVVDGVDSLFNALSEAIGPEQLQKLDAIGGSLTAAANAASSANVVTSQIPSSSVVETVPSGMRIISSNSSISLGGGATTNIIPSSSTISSISNNNNISVSKSNSTNVITLSDLLGSPTVVSSSGGGISSYSPIILSSVNSTSVSSASNAINSSPTLSSLLNSVSTSIGGGLPASSSSASVTSTAVTQSSIVSSTPRLSALLAGTPSADTVVLGSNGPSSSSLLSPAGGTADSSTGGANSASYGSLLDRLAASLNQPQGTTSQVRTGASRLNPIASATPSVVLDHPVLAATLTQQQQPSSVSGTLTGTTTTGNSRGSSTFRQIAPAPSPVSTTVTSSASTSGGNTVAVINASDIQSHSIQSPQLINLLGLVGSNSSGAGTGQPRQIRINTSSPANNPSPGAASR